jgi:hydroxymethylglutaryl-CoA lyase
MTGERVSVYEVGPRDGLQNEAVTLPAADKVRFVELLAESGLQAVEVTSFVSPRAVPQLADAGEVLPAVHRREGVRYPVLVPNLRGLERARAAGAREVALFAAASERFSHANIGRSIGESLAGYAEVAAEARAAGMWLRGYVSTAFHCPYEGAVDPEAAVRVARELRRMGCEEISVGDTIGRAEPAEVAALVPRLAAAVPLERIALHLHDTGGRALANVAAGLEAGVRTFDGSAAGLGGCPFAPGAPGNLATEALVAFLERSGYATGVDEERLAAAAAFVRERLAAAA